MERIATDLLGELPLTERGNRYILVVSDYFTKWTECFAIPNMEARTVADVIVRQIIARFGVPSAIHSDQGQLLKAYVNEHQTDWDDHLPFVTMAYRSVEHKTTGCSPNYLMLGREVQTPLDIMYELPSSVKNNPENRWVWELKEKMEATHKLVRENIAGAMLRQKSLHDRNVSWRSFKNDDGVYVFFPRHKVGQSPKLTSFWRVPFKVIEKCTDVTYKIPCGQRGKPQVIHVDRIKAKKQQILSFERPENTQGDVIIDMDF